MTIDWEDARKPTQAVVAGIWKFDMSKVDVGQLIDIATVWRLKEQGIRYEYLHVRQCSDKQWGIGFQVALCTKTSEEFFHAMTDQLKRKFGNDFVGWDYSKSVWAIDCDRCDAPVRVS